MKHRASLIFLALIWCHGCGEPQMVLKRPTELTVVVAQPVQKRITDYNEYTGRTEAVGFVEVRARVTGYINKVVFTEGQEVKKGDLLFEIDPRPFEAKVKQVEAKLASDQAKLRELTAEYNRNKILHDRKALSLEELQQSEAARDVTAANIMADKAELEAAKLDLEFSKVTSPIDGRAGRAEIKEGNLISAQSSGSPVLTTIVPFKQIYVYFDLDERKLLERLGNIKDREIQLGNIRDVKIPVEIGLADSKDFPYQGVVDFIDNKVDAGTGTIQVRAVIDNPMKLLSPGFFARVRVPEPEGHDALLIPDLAILTDQGLKYVWVVDQAGVVSRRNVTLGSVNSGVREIKLGLGLEDQVIVQGIQRVRENAKVVVKLAKLNSDGQLMEESVRTGADAGAGGKAELPESGTEPIKKDEISPAATKKQGA